jgi:hypothetical protein
MKSREIGIAGYDVEGVEKQTDIEVKARFDTKPEGCLRCGSKRIVSKGPYSRKVRHLDSFGIGPI